MIALRKPLLGAALALGLPGWAADHAGAPDGVLMQAMRDELHRSMQSLVMENMEKPYFLAYRVDEVEGFNVSARFGALVTSSRSHRRTLTVELRVGSPDFDNTNFLVGLGSGASLSLPLEDDYGEIRRQLWLATDLAYKQAQKVLASKRAAHQNRTREEMPDFAAAVPTRTFDEADASTWTPEAAESLTRDLSALFKEFAAIHQSRVHTEVSNRRSYYLSSEDTAYIHARPSVRLRAWASTQASDGTVLEDSVQFHARSDPLPDRETLAQRVVAMADTLSARREAEPLDRYSGPVLFEGQAAAELFAEVFAPRLLAVRVPSASDSNFERTAARARNPFADKLGARVLPRFLDVRDDPTINRYGEGQLHGGYRVDDEGVPSARTILVERGRLKTLLASRNPAEGIPSSTGNRRGIAPSPSNLIVGTDRGLSESELRDEFLALVRERGNDFGIVVRRLDGRSEVVGAAKLYPDGREVPIRKAELSGVSESTFKDIVAVSDTPTVHTLRFPNSRTSILRRTSAVFGSPRYDMTGSVVIPDLLFEEVSLRKPLGNRPLPPVAAHPHFQETR